MPGFNDQKWEKRKESFENGGDGDLEEKNAHNQHFLFFP